MPLFSQMTNQMHKTKQIVAVCAALLLLLLELQSRVAWDRPRLSGRVLLRGRFTPWVRFFNRGGDLDFMHLMGLDRAAFHKLLATFTTAYDQTNMNGSAVTSRFANHAKRVLSAAAVLGLVLHWLHSTAEEKYLFLTNLDI